MKRKDAYWCTDCDEIFVQNEHNIVSYVYNPICPICGSKSALNLERVLNRKEEVKDDKTYFDYDAVHGCNVPNSKSVVHCSSVVKGGITGDGSAPVGGKSTITRSGGEDIESSVVSKQTDRDFKSLDYLVNVLGICLQSQSDIKQGLQRINANPVSNLRGESERINRHKYLDRQVEDNKGRLPKSDYDI